MLVLLKMPNEIFSVIAILFIWRQVSRQGPPLRRSKFVSVYFIKSAVSHNLLNIPVIHRIATFY